MEKTILCILGSWTFSHNLDSKRTFECAMIEHVGKRSSPMLFYADGNFRVKLDNERVILAYTAGKLRKFFIRTGAGDRVTEEDVTLRPCARADHLPPQIGATGQRRAMWRKRR
jgi:translation initiation factor IF-1